MEMIAKGGLSPLLFNVRRVLNRSATVFLVTAVLAFCVLWQAGSLVWKLWLLSNESPQPGVPIALPVKNAEPDSLQNLVRYPLIQSESAASEQGSASIDAPETSLNLKLVGLMYSTDQNEARAIIESPNEGASSYAAHERVADNAEIYRIEPDRVILLHAGRQEALMLAPEHENSGFRPDPGKRPVNDPMRNQASSESASASRQNLPETPKTPAELMDDFSVTPVIENGELLGFRLKAIRNPNIMNEWGIHPDDVITAVNGIPLNAPGKVMVLYDKLKKQSEFEVTLNDGDANRTITIDLTE